MKHRSGIVSMFTALIMSIFFVSLALGMILLANGSTQQASDDELSQRAFAAADGGIEWALAQLANGASFTPGACNTLNTGNLYNFGNAIAANQNSITCLTVAKNSNAVTGQVSNNTAQQINLGAVNPAMTHLKVSWTTPSNGVPAGYDCYSTSLPPAGALCHGQAQQPGVEVTIVHYTTSGVCQPPAICSVQYQNSPGFSNGAGPANGITIKQTIVLPNTSTSIDGDSVSKYFSLCQPPASAGYACTSPQLCINQDVPGGCVITSGPTEGIMVYLRGIYAPTPINFQVQFYNTSTPVPTPNPNYTIDVTARSGPVYRRIVAQTQTNGTNVPVGLNYVLFGDQNICKDFSIFPNSPAPTYQVNSLCTSPSQP